MIWMSVVKKGDDWFQFSLCQQRCIVLRLSFRDEIDVSPTDSTVAQAVQKWLTRILQGIVQHPLHLSVRSGLYLSGMLSPPFRI